MSKLTYKEIKSNLMKSYPNFKNTVVRCYTYMGANNGKTLANIELEKKYINFPLHIFVSGKKFHGKDTLGKYFMKDAMAFQRGFIKASELIDQGLQTSGVDLYSFNVFDPYIKQINFADPIKDFSKKYLGFDNEQLYGDRKETNHVYWNMTPREMMQKFGTNLRLINPDIFVKIATLKMKEHVANHKNYYKPITINTDTRYPNEIELARYELSPQNCCFIKVIRPGLKPTEFDNHPSETALDSYQHWDYIIENDGSKKDLKKKANQVIQEWFGLARKSQSGAII